MPKKKTEDVVEESSIKEGEATTAKTSKKATAKTSKKDDSSEAAKDSDLKTPKTAAKLEEEGDIAADYLEALLDIADLDGDIDIAAISFFPDYKNRPEESFVYLENDGKNNFKASTIADPTMGRWIVMDVADYDKDGDEDLILGSLAFEVIPTNNDLINKWVNNGIPFIVLENKTKHR
jgi:hypothetical protein